MTNTKTTLGYFDNAFSPIDEFGNRVEKTKSTHPYSYDGFVVFRAGTNKEANGTVYSDRMRQWDYDKNKKLCYKHFGNESDYWNNRTPDKIQSFLRDYMNDPDLKLILIMEYCNQSSGYPVWRFDYHHSK